MPKLLVDATRSCVRSGAADRLGKAPPESAPSCGSQTAMSQATVCKQSDEKTKVRRKEMKQSGAEEDRGYPCESPQKDFLYFAMKVRGGRVKVKGEPTEFMVRLSGEINEVIAKALARAK